MYCIKLGNREDYISVLLLQLMCVGKENIMVLRSCIADLAYVGSCKASRPQLDSGFCIVQGALSIAKGQSNPTSVCMQRVLSFRHFQLYPFAVCTFSSWQVSASGLCIPLQAQLQGME